MVTIYRGLMAVANAYARYGKGKMPATVILSAVVERKKMIEGDLFCSVVS